MIEKTGIDAQPLVSVVIIFLNAEKYIGEAIDSVLAQSYQNWELILVDDGSRATCTSIAQNYAARYSDKIHYIDHENHANKGMSASRNAGIKIATGEFVALIDADDQWFPEKLKQQVEIMQLHPEVGLICGTVNYWKSWEGGIDVLTPTGHRQDCMIRPPETSLALYPLGKAPAPPPSDILFRRDLALSVGCFESHFSGQRQLYEDQGFLSKIYLAAPIWISSRNWLNYRQHSASCVANSSRDGGHSAVRIYFMEWFQSYLATQANVDPKINGAVKRALWIQRHPRTVATILFFLKLVKRSK